jgi:hypothetical protein
MGCSAVLLKIVMSQVIILELIKTSRMLFRYLSAVTGSSRSFRTILSFIEYPTRMHSFFNKILRTKLLWRLTMFVIVQLLCNKLNHTFLMVLFFITYLTRNFLKHTYGTSDIKIVYFVQREIGRF